MTWISILVSLTEPSSALHRVDAEEKSLELASTRLSRHGQKLKIPSTPLERPDVLVFGTWSDLSGCVYFKMKSSKSGIIARTIYGKGERPQFLVLPFK